MQPAPPPPAGVPAEPDVDLALVVVHGIGEQARGTTLLAWAEPLARRLHRRAVAEGGTGVTVTASRLTTADDPSEVTLRIGRGVRGVRTVRISEARWAESFLTVAPAEVLSWGRSFLGRAGLRFARHVALGWTTTWALFRERAAQVRLLSDVPLLTVVPNTVALVLLISAAVLAVPLVLAGLGLVALVVGVLLAGLTAVATVLLAVALRIPLLRRAVRGVAAALVTTVGDATAWTRHPLLAAAMRDEIRREVARARTRTGTVVLLGHSQGAAISADTVLHPQPGDAPVDLLVTVGGAVGLLGGTAWSAGAAAEDPVTAWRGRPELRWINVWAGWDPVPSGPVATDATATGQRWRESFAASFAERSAQTRGVQAWLDRLRLKVQAVAPGLAAAGTPPREVDRFPYAEVPGPTEWPVHNRASVLTDHTTYHRNLPQVIDPLAAILLTGVGELPGWGLRPSAAAQVHATAVRILGTTRLVAAAAAAVLTVATSATAASLPVLDWLTSAVRPLSDNATVGLEWLARQSWRGTGQLVLTGLLTWVVLLAVGSGLAGRWLDAVAWSRRGAGAWAVATYGYLVLLAGAPSAYLAVVLSRHTTADWAVWLSAGLVVVIACGLPLGGLRPAPLPARR